MGRKKRDWSEWLLRVEVHVDGAKLKADWVYDYLVGKGVAELSERWAGGINEAELASFLVKQSADPKGLVALNKMAAAWGRYYRSKQTPQLCVAVSNQAYDEFQKLCDWNGASYQETLEGLITRGFDFEKEERKYRRNDLKMARKEAKKEAEKKIYNLPLPGVQRSAQKAVETIEAELVKIKLGLAPFASLRPPEDDA